MSAQFIATEEALIGVFLAGLVAGVLISGAILGIAYWFSTPEDDEHDPHSEPYGG